MPIISVADHATEFLQDSDYWISTDVWGAGSLTRGTYTGPDGTEYEQKVGVESPAKNPGGGRVAMRTTWAWPLGTTEVKSYPHVHAGNQPGYWNSWVTPGGYTVTLPDGSTSMTYPSGSTPGTFFPVALPITGALKSHVSYFHNVAPSGRGHLSYDIWLQSSPTQENGVHCPPVTTEIMIPVDYWGAPHPYGVYPYRNPSWYSHDDTIDGRLYHIYYAPSFNGQWKFVVFEPDQPTPSGTQLDLKAFINYAITAGYTGAVDPSNPAATHVVSVALGVEPQDGVGDLTIYDFDVTNT